MTMILCAFAMMLKWNALTIANYGICVQVVEGSLSQELSACMEESHLE